MTLNRQIILTALTLLVVIVFFGMNDVDVLLQNLFYNSAQHRWILSPYAEPYNFLLYYGLKRLLIAIAVLFLLALIFLWKTKIVREYKRGMVILVLSAIFVPAIASGLKAKTDMPCPRDEIIYGGVYPRTAVWQSYDKEFKLTHHRTKCWPAGHASGGFALLSLFFLFKKRRNKKIGIAIGLSVGWAMGLYKMIIGDHFLSHTVITMMLAWLIILLIAKAVNTIHVLKL